MTRGARGAQRLLLALLAVVASIVALGAVASPASASDACTAGHNAAGQSVYYCGVWVPSGGVPVYAATSTGASVVDHLHSGGTANWFFCSAAGGTAHASGYTSTNWARTVGDDAGATGWVPAVYFSGSASSWTGLPGCSGSSGTSSTRCTSGSNQAGTSVFYCPVWVPSGGVPVYSTTSTGSTVVDHLHTGGSANWFFCHLAGSTATAAGYSSSDWAKTVGDDSGATGYVPAVYFAGSQASWYGLAASCGTALPPPSDGACTAGTDSSGGAVYYCPVWLPSGGVPVYASTSTSSGVVGTFAVGGSSNWFTCQTTGSTASAGGGSSSHWGKTVADNGRAGWVPAVYYPGSQDYWPGLPTCTGGSTPPPPPPSDGGGTTSGAACGSSLSSLPARTLALLKAMCSVTDPSSAMWPYRIYAWNGGHTGTPGPSRGSCSPQNGAPNDCNVIGFDCSGLVRYAYWKASGVDALDGYTWGQWSDGLSLPHQAVVNGADNGGSGQVDDHLSSLRPGDVLFYGSNADEHVAVYLGGGKQVNAYQSGTPDGVTGVDTDITFWGAIRFW